VPHDLFSLADGDLLAISECCKRAPKIVPAQPWHSQLRAGRFEVALDNGIRAKWLSTALLATGDSDKGQ
jgi:hypothetical protein